MLKEESKSSAGKRVAIRADNETQAAETKCTAACWTNYTRRVVARLKFQKRSALKFSSRANETQILQA